MTLVWNLWKVVFDHGKAGTRFVLPVACGMRKSSKCMGGHVMHNLLPVVDNKINREILSKMFMF